VKRNIFKHRNKLISQYAALPVLVGLVGLVWAPAAPAFEFKNGEVSGSFDTTVSVGAAWRVEKRDRSLVGIANGGTARSVNEDNGDLNYENNDL